MDKIRVLMIDDNENLVSMIEEYFSKDNKIDVVLKAYNGLDGIKLIEENENKFDLILLDLIMPNKDGLYVLEELKKRKIKKKVIVETSYNTTDIIKKVSSYGINYFLLKPYDLSDLHSRILNVCEEDETNINDNHLQVTISKILHELGIPSHIKGYQYIREAIEIIYERPNVIGGITKELYPELAHKFDTTTSRVERAIRHAIEVSWNRGSWDLMEDIFGHSVDIDKAKPTNSEFIVTVADKLKLDTIKV